MKTKYTVIFPDGTTATRNSARKYTHAIAVNENVYSNRQDTPVSRKWAAVSFCGSLELAEKSKSGFSVRYNHETLKTLTVLPVNA